MGLKLAPNQEPVKMPGEFLEKRSDLPQAKVWDWTCPRCGTVSHFLDSVPLAPVCLKCHFASPTVIDGKEAQNCGCEPDCDCKGNCK